MNTLQAAHALENAGFPTEQAEALTNVLHEALQSDVATKADLNALEAKILKLMVGQTLTIVALVFALLKFMLPQAPP